MYSQPSIQLLVSHSQPSIQPLVPHKQPSIQPLVLHSHTSIQHMVFHSQPSIQSLVLHSQLSIQPLVPHSQPSIQLLVLHSQPSSQPLVLPNHLKLCGCRSSSSSIPTVTNRLISFLQYFFVVSITLCNTLTMKTLLSRSQTHHHDHCNPYLHLSPNQLLRWQEACSPLLPQALSSRVTRTVICRTIRPSSLHCNVCKYCPTTSTRPWSSCRN